MADPPAPVTVPRRPLHRLLQGSDLRSAARLNLGLSGALDSPYIGRHRSRRLGPGVEFADHRRWVPGDDPRRIDHKAWARTDRLLVRRAEDLGRLGVTLLVDASASMAFPDPPARGDWTKFEQAQRMAAVAAFAAVRQQDRVSLGIARHGLQAELPAGGGMRQLNALLERLDAPATGAPDAGLAEAIAALDRRHRGRGLLLVFSDLLDAPGPILRAAARFRRHGGGVVFYQLLHEREFKLDADGQVTAVDCESRERTTVDLDLARDGYRHALRAMTERWSEACRERRMQHLLIRCPAPPAEAVARAFARSTAGA